MLPAARQSYHSAEPKRADNWSFFKWHLVANRTFEKRPETRTKRLLFCGECPHKIKVAYLAKAVRAKNTPLFFLFVCLRLFGIYFSAFGVRGKRQQKKEPKAERNATNIKTPIDINGGITFQEKQNWPTNTNSIT